MTESAELEDSIYRALFENPSIGGGLADLICISPENHAAYVMALDRLGIYGQRKALNKAGVPTQVWRGEEWWH